MTLNVTLANEHLYWPNPETVTVVQERNVLHGGNAEDTLDYAHRMDATTARRAFGIIQLASNEVVWVIPASLLDNVSEITQGCRIKVSQTERYVVGEATLVKMGTQWVCRTTKERN